MEPQVEQPQNNDHKEQKGPRKKKRAAGLFGVKSNVKLFSFRGELWSDEDSNDTDDDDFQPSDDDLSESQGNGRVPKNGEDATATLATMSSNGDSSDEKPVKKVPRLTLKLPSRANATNNNAVPVREKRKYMKRGKGAKRKEAYYEPETQELQVSRRTRFAMRCYVAALRLQAEAMVDTMQSSAGASRGRTLKAVIRENRLRNGEPVLPAEILTKIFKRMVDMEPKRTVQTLSWYCFTNRSIEINVFVISNSLSSVCEEWRQVVLESPELWVSSGSLSSKGILVSRY